MLYKLKIQGSKKYLHNTFSDAVSATIFAIDMFKDIPITVYRKNKYHKRQVTIDGKSIWALKIRCGVIVAGGKLSDLDFFKQMYGQ